MRNQSNNLLYRKYIAALATAYRDRSDIRMFIEMLLTSAAIFMFSIFAIRPTLVTIGGLTTEISEKHETIATMDTKIANIIAAQDLYTQNATRLSLLDTAVPAAPTVAEYIKQIEQVATTHSVEVFSLTTSNIPISTPVGTENTEQKIVFNITFTGEYPGLLATLKDLENLRRPLMPTTTSLSLDESSDAGAKIYLSVVGDIPYWPVQITENPIQ